MQAKKMLKHRNGTLFEDLAYIDSSTGEVLTQENYNKKQKVSPTRSMNKMLKNADDNTIIGIHNHPTSSVPSYADLATADIRKYKYGIVACHDGTIYKYAITGELNQPMAEAALDMMARSGYSKDIAKYFTDAGVEMEVL